MPKLNTTVKSVRIDNDTLNELEKRIDGSFNAWLNEVIEDYLGPKKPKTVDNTGVYPKTSDTALGFTLDNIDQMARLMGSSLEDILGGLNRGLEDGTLTVEGNKIVGVTELNLNGLYEVCHEKNIEPQKAIDKAVQMLWK